MIRTTYLICNVCKGEMVWVSQNGSNVQSTAPKEQFAFVSQHIMTCRDGHPPTATDAGFTTQMRDGSGKPVEGAQSGIEVRTT